MRSFIFSLLVFAFLSCEVKVSTAGTEDKKKTSYSRNTEKIRNGIELQTTGGVKVEQAYLTYADDGAMVDEDNITALNRKLKLVMLVEGWKEENGRVFLEASEKVTSSDGDVIMNANNLFGNNGIVSVSPEDAGRINLDVVISRISKIFDHFLVEFKVWNTRAEQEISGSYKFHLDKM